MLPTQVLDRSKRGRTAYPDPCDQDGRTGDVQKIKMILNHQLAQDTACTLVLTLPLLFKYFVSKAKVLRVSASERARAT